MMASLLIVLALKEDKIVSVLNAVVVAHPYVNFGSYLLVLASDEDVSRTSSPKYCHLDSDGGTWQRVVHARRI